MGKTWMISDLHFHHKKICEYTDRKLVIAQEEHDEWLIDLWNSQVNKADKIFHLGDFSFAHEYENLAKVLRRLNGQKFFIKGNHDRTELLKSIKLSGLIQEWYDYKEIKLEDKNLVLFHFPIASWHRQSYGSIHLHGHLHGSPSGLNGKVLDVGLDNAYKMLGEHKFFSLDFVLEYMQDKQVVERNYT